MMDFCGSDLSNTFNILGTSIGSISQLTIDAWFNTDCNATKELLQWLLTYLSEENVLTAHQIEEYQQLEKGLLVTGKLYENNLLELQSKFPGILDYEENLFEADCLQDELEILLEEERHLEHVIKINEILNAKLSKEMKIASDEEIKLSVQKDVAKKKCMESSYRLDGIHEKLQQQINRYAKHLNEFENFEKPMFISNMCTKMYDQHYLSVNSFLEPFLHIQHELSVTNSSIKKDSLDLSNELDILQQRISKSMLLYFNKQLEEEKLRAKLQFMKELSVDESSRSFADSSCFTLKAAILQKEELLRVYLEELQSVTRHQTDAYLEELRLSLTKTTLNSNQTRLEALTQVGAKVVKVLAKHMLLHSFLKKESDDIKSTDKFFRDVHRYIIDNLYSCHSRTEGMTEVIDRYRSHSSLPLEERLKLAEIIRTLITDQPQRTDAKIVDIISNFKNECSQLEQQVFFNDYIEHRRNSQEIEHDIAVMQKFLISGPTHQITIIPRQLLDTFEELDRLRETQEGQMKAAMQIFNQAKNKLEEDKWFCIKRQLWMWFLLEPKRLLNAIEQIEAEVKQKRHETAAVNLS